VSITSCAGLKSGCSRAFATRARDPARQVMLVRHVLLLLFALLPLIGSLSPPKHRPPRSTGPDAKYSAHNDPSIIVPLYKEALKADAEGRPQDSLKLLTTPPLSLAPGILATCCPATPAPSSSHVNAPIRTTNHRREFADTLQLNLQFCSAVHEASSLGRGRARHS
jgi:hypothetical protein